MTTAPNAGMVDVALGKAEQDKGNTTADRAMLLVFVFHHVSPMPGEWRGCGSNYVTTRLPVNSSGEDII